MQSSTLVSQRLPRASRHQSEDGGEDERDISRFTGETVGALTQEGVQLVDARGVVHARRGKALVDVLVAVQSLPAGLTLADVFPRLQFKRIVFIGCSFIDIH